MRTRKANRTLTGTNIMLRRGKYRYESTVPILNPVTGALQKTHYLCDFSEGESKARDALQRLLGTAESLKGAGDFSAWIDKWKIDLNEDHKLKKPKDPARIKTWEKSWKNISSAL